MPNYGYIRGVLSHRQQVGLLLCSAISELASRAVAHDHSKLGVEEADPYEEMIAKLQNVQYGTPEYRQIIAANPGVAHHYSVNRHHPEYFTDGIAGMNLFDLVEMVCDWLAANMRAGGGDIDAMLAVNKERFGIDDQLFSIIAHTVGALIAETKV